MTRPTFERQCDCSTEKIIINCYLHRPRTARREKRARIGLSRAHRLDLVSFPFSRPQRQYAKYFPNPLQSLRVHTTADHPTRLLYHHDTHCCGIHKRQTYRCSHHAVHGFVLNRLLAASTARASLETSVHTVASLLIVHTLHPREEYFTNRLNDNCLCFIPRRDTDCQLNCRSSQF